MKTSILYATLALVGISSAQEACVEGKRVTIRPGYTVEYRCNKYRAGQRHNNILSHEDCAALCEANGLDVCTYNAAKKVCIVGDPNGKEGVSNGATYMIKVEEEEKEDPFADDPFEETCEEQNVNLRAQINDLKDEVEKCRADQGGSSSPPNPPSCGVNKWGHGYYEVKYGMNINNCKQACDADDKCLSYSANKGNTGQINCYLYSKETADVPDRTYPNFVQYDKRCG